MRKVLNFVKGKRDDKKDTNLSLNVTNISVEITDPAGVTTPSDDYDFVGSAQHCTDYEVDLSGKDKSISKLHKAAWVGNLEKIKSHLKKIDVNVVDASNRTPLHLAAAQGHTNVVWFLLSNKAQMDIYDAGGKTSFLKAVEGGYKEIVSNMLEKGAEINSKDAEGNTALHIATKLGYYDIATVLLKNGANFEGANKKGEYALHIATTAEHMDLVELLLRYGAAVNVCDSDARTPLMLAARCGNAPLVELFLEYRAKRDMVDNSCFTAQDYAINKGYGDLAALLVTASLERVEEEDKIDDTETDTSPPDMEKQRSVSSGSLVPANGSHLDVSDEPAEDGDSWNDSNMSDSNKETKISPSKLKKFLTPSSDDELSEEPSPTKEEKNVHDSPNSCVIPPPLKPPRSWDLIQAGMIDDNNGSEVKRCSLTALGTLRSRRESFNDSTKSDLESPMSFKDGSDAKELEKGGPTTSKTNSSSKVPETTVLKRDKSDLSTVESDWDSDESLPLDKSAAAVSSDKESSSPKKNHQVSVDVHQEPTDDEELPAPPSPSQLTAPEDNCFLQVSNQSAPGSGAVSPEPVSEKRARMLLMQNQQSVELTLTDDRTEDKSDASEGSPSALPRDGDAENNGQISPSVTGTLGREGTMLGYEELWESNAAFAPSSPPANQEPSLSTSHSLPRIDEKAETSEGEQSPCSQIIIDLNTSKITQISDCIDIVTSPIGKSVSSIPPPGPLAIVGKSEEVEDLTKKLQDSKPISTKRHVRNKSIFQLTPQGEPVQLPEPPHPELHLPSALAIQDQIINRQLECYDIAIRDLAVSSTSKQGPPKLNPLAIQGLGSSKVNESDSFIDEGHRIMPDLLAGSKVAALAAAFSGESNISKQKPKSQTDQEMETSKKEEESWESEDSEEQGEGVTSAVKQGSVEKPIRKKRKSLLALQKLEPTSSQGSQGNEKENVEDSSSDSDGEPAYWGSAGVNKVLRQSTVIKKDNGGHDAAPSVLSPESLSLEDIQRTSSTLSSNEDVTAPVEDVVGSSNTVGLINADGKEMKTSVADSDADSAASQTDGTPTHSYSKSHESLLKHHLKVVTEERGRLAETTVELGEKTERLMYELADAREAARARDEVITLLQMQLQRLEESHIKGLEEVQTHRFHLDTRDQELRHLEEVCRKAQEEAIHLKEIIRLKDKEIANLTQMRVNKDEEAQIQSMARVKEKDITINELRIHLKYVEQERDRLKETLVTMEHQQASLQARTEALLEENSRTSTQIASDLRNTQEETNKWRTLYESCLLKLEAMDSTQVKVLLDSKNSENEASQAFHHEIRSAVERLEKEKEADRQIWQAKIKEEVANAVHLLKSEYEKVEEALRKHNSTLEAMVEKLKIDHDIAVKRQEGLENQLKSTQDELQQKQRDTSELSHLQLEVSRLKHQVFTDSNRLKILESELDSKDQSLTDLRKTLGIVRQEKKELSSLLSVIYQKQDSQEEGKPSDLEENHIIKDSLEGCGKEQTEKSEEKIVDDYPTIINKLLRENGELNEKIDKLNHQVRQLQREHTATLEQYHLLKEKGMPLSMHDHQKVTANKVTLELQNTFQQEKEELLRQIAELRMKLQKRDSSPSSANLCNASAMTDQVRWNQTGLMGVVQKQKEEIDSLRLECAKLRSSNKSPTSPSTLSSVPPEIKQRPGKSPPGSSKVSPDTIDLLKSTKRDKLEQAGDQSRDFLSPQPFICKRCGNHASPSKPLPSIQSRKNSTHTQTIEGCESPAHSSKCLSPRHNWSNKAGNNIEQELQAQAEKCLKHQQMIAGLKSELHLLRGGNGDYQSNLQKQVSDLQQKIKDEIALRSSLELQMNKMKYEVQEKGQVEKELEKLKGRLEKEFVSRRELDHYRMRARVDETSELSTKLAQVNKLLLQQAHDRNTGQSKENVDAQIRKEYEETRQYLVSELAKVQASLQAKENEEKELKLKCEKLSRECDRKNEQRRKMLIEKSYNLGQQFLKEKYSVSNEQKLNPLLALNPDPNSCNSQSAKEASAPSENPYSELLRKEVKKSAEKYKSPDPIPDVPCGAKSEERMTYLKKKYCLP